jgi:uncharacterized membrane protein
MNFNPLLEASIAIQMHTAAAVVAIGLSLAMLAARKGTATHKLLGRTWVAMMAAVSISSFWIVELRHGQFSPIHLLSAVTLAALVYAIWQAKRGNIRAHKRSMLMTMAGALAGAGAFTLMPGRIMGQVFFG